MTERATAAPPIFPFPDHRNMGVVARDEYAASFHKPYVEPVMLEPVAIKPHANVAGKIWCRHCEINWAPKAVRACIRTSCPAKAELP